MSRSLTRKHFCAALLAASFCLPAATALAQSYPTHALRIVVPFGAGGVADLTVRTVAQKMATSLRQAVVIDNKPGAGGVLAADTVAKAAPDGYTLLLMSNGTAVSVGLFKSLPFDPVRDFAPLSTMGYFDLALVVPSGGRFKTSADLLAYARANPGKLNLGTINIGSTQNLAAELLKLRAGLDVQVVPFNGTPALTGALRGGQVDAAIEILSPLMGQIQSGALQALAVLGESRAPQLPNVPTLGQAGVADFNVSSWNALAAPAKTPPAVLERLNREIAAAVNAPDVRATLASNGVTARASTPQQMTSLLTGEIRRWTDVISRAGVPKQ